MLFAKHWPLAAMVLAVGFLLGMAGSAMADDAPQMPTSPAVSTFAPADDLVDQVEQYLKELDECVADDAAYKEAVEGGKISREANTLIVIALALGLHDQENKHKGNASDIMKAAKELAATKDLESAKKAMAALHTAAKGNGQGGAALKWEPVAALPELMKQVPIVNTKLKLNLKGKISKSKAKKAAGYSAVLAVIAQATIADTSATKNPAEVKQWYEWSVLARDYAAQVNAAAHNDKTAEDAMAKMTKNCDDCHAVFKPGVIAGAAAPAAAPAAAD